MLQNCLSFCRKFIHKRLQQVVLRVWSVVNLPTASYRCGINPLNLHFFRDRGHHLPQWVIGPCNCIC